jgi:Domain of unknown function (DUF4928)
MPVDLTSFLDTYGKKQKRYVPARLQAALALLEKLRELPSLELTEHQEPGSSGMKGHESYGARAHKRFELDPINKNHGRRSCNLAQWGQPLLDEMKSAGFENATAEQRERLIHEAQAMLVAPLRAIIEQDPLEARIKGRSAEAVIADILQDADEKGKLGDVAQYLVGAKLMLRLKREIPVHSANKSDRKHRADEAAKWGDFVIENAVIEVAMGSQDDKHLQQIEEIVENTDKEVWLLTRKDREAGWKDAIKGSPDIKSDRVVVNSVEAFVGQNITELAGFSATGKASQLKELFDLYNTRWVAKVGTPGIRIIMK